MSRKKKDQSFWTLRPADLPTERAMRREPRLADIAENAVFRLMTHRTRAVMARVSIFSPKVIAAVVAYSAAIFALFRFGRADAWIWIVVLVSGASQIRGLLRGGGPSKSDAAGESSFIFGRPFILDLILCVLTPRDFAAAVWACSVRRRNLLVGKIGSASLAGVSVAVLASGDALPRGLAHAGAFVLAATAGYATSLAFDPYPILATQAASIHVQRLSAEFVARPFKVLKRAIVGAAKLLAIAAGCFVIVLALLAGVFRSAPSWRSTLMNPWVIAAVFSLVAFLAAYARGVYVRRRASRYFDQMTQDFAVILEQARRRETGRESNG